MRPCDSLACQSHFGVMQFRLNIRSVRRTQAFLLKWKCYIQEHIWPDSSSVFSLIEKVMPVPLVETLFPTSSLRKSDELSGSLNSQKSPKY